MPKLYTAVEASSYSTRSTNGPARVTGDFGFTRSPSDWVYIENEKNAFIANPTAARWDGPRTSTLPIPSATTFEYGTGKDAIDKPTLQRLQSAAFWAFIKNDSTIKNLVITEILYYATRPKLQFGNSSVWSLSSGHSDSFYMFEMAISGIMLLYAWDYVEESASTANAATINAWFKGLADFMKDQFTANLNNYFVSRTVPIEQYQYRGATSPTVRATVGGSENSVAIAAWDTWPLHRHYNNRRAHMAVISALYGYKYSSQVHIDEAKKFARETIAFFVKGDGVFSELERSDNALPSKGLNYSLTTITCLIQIADACARAGDFSMYNFKTKFGLGGTASTVDKSIEWMILEWGKYLNGTKRVYSKEGTVGNESFRIDGTHTNWTLCGQVCHFAIAALYYSNPAVKAIYTMDTTRGYYSIPTTGIGTSGQMLYYQALTGFGHGLFKYGGLEAANVYAVVASAPSAPANINISSITTSGFTVNWSVSANASNYELDVATDSAFTSIVPGYNDLTVNGVSQAVTGLDDNTIYYARVRASNNLGTSGNTITVSATTTDIPDVEPDPIYPNLVLRREMEGNYSVITDADGDIGENVDVVRSGGKDIKIWDIGDKISINWNVPLNRYIIKVKARCGNSVNRLAFQNSYRFAVNGVVIPATLDQTSIGLLEAGYGGAYWGTYILDNVISSSRGLNTLTIESLSSFLGVDFVEFYKNEDNTTTKYTIDQLIGIAKIQGTTVINTPEELFNQIKTQTISVTLDSASILLQTQVNSTIEGIINKLKAPVNPVDTTPKFTLTQAESVSLGVYKPDGTKVRSLFENTPHGIGTHTIYWDGKDDAGLTVADGPYDFNVTSGNVSGEWQGVIGNNSTDLTGATVWRGFDRMYDLTTLGSYTYVGIGYNEGQTSHVKFLNSDPHKKIKILPASGSNANMEVRRVANDGVNIFWAGVDPFSTNKNISFIVATKASDDTEYLFASGASYKCVLGRTYAKAISVVDSVGSDITGLASQRTGNYLFASRKGINGGTLYVLNRTTGAAVRTIVIPGVDKLAVDSADNLWIHVGTTVNKYTVNGDGTITIIPSIGITGLSSPQGLGCNNTDLYVLDGGSSQQIKKYNSSGTLLSTQGILGGYASNAVVANDKFFFNDGAGRVSASGISFSVDGTYRVLDTGNNRIQMYNSSNVWTDRVTFLPKCWSCVVDRTNPTRVFGDYWEFRVDYTKTLQETGGWELINNWGYNVPASKDDIQKRLQFLTTIQGRTFACQPSGSNWELVELKANGTLIFTGRTFARDFWQMYADGSIRRFNATLSVSGTPTWSMRANTGLDAIGPVWGTEATICTAPTKKATDPVPYGNKLVSMTTGEITASNILVTFDGHFAPFGSSGDHIGGIRVGSNQYLWKAAPSTHTGYTGIYPKKGAYDVGNSIQYGGSKALVLDNWVLWGYHGEFWKGGQVNKYNILTDKGLMVGQFGTTSWDVNFGEAAAEMAGNAFHPNFVKYNGEYYLYHNDESFHGGIHRWKINGLSSVKETLIRYSLDVTKPLVNPETGIDMVAGLPGLSTQLAVGNGWSTNVAGYVNTGAFSNKFDVRSGVKTFGSEKDIWWWLFSPTTRTENITRDLGTNIGLQSYNLKMQVSFEDTIPNTNEGGQYLELLDSSNRIIARWYHSQTFGGTNPISVYGGNQLLGTDSETNMKLITWRPNNLTITVDSTGVKYKYANYAEKTAPLFDLAADRTAPKTFRVVVFKNSGTTYARTGSVANLKLYK
jgi:flagellar hook assembly protein FlgD